MSDSVTTKDAATSTTDSVEARQPNPAEDKGKGKGKVVENDAMEEDDEEDDDDDVDVDDDEEEDEDEEMEEDEGGEIDPRAILPSGRRTRGIKVDYTSEEALKRAGLENAQDDDEEDEDAKAS